MSTRKPLTTAVIVTYDSCGHINEALAALQVAYNSGNLECVVVDNASTDGTADFVTALHPWVNLVKSKQNIGFGRGCNLGFEEVKTPYVLFHNPDAVLKYQDLKILLDFMESNPKAGIIAPAIIEGKNSFQAAGLMTTPTTLLKTSLGLGKPLAQKRYIIPGTPAFQTSWVCGAMILIRSDLFRCLNGFDPRFFLYFEETDLCRRAVQNGAEIWAMGEAVAYHIGGASAKSTGQAIESSCISEHFYRSRFYYLAKHFGLPRAVGTEILLRVLANLHFWRNYITGREPNNFNGKKVPFLRFPETPGNKP